MMEILLCIEMLLKYTKDQLNELPYHEWSYYNKVNGYC